MSDEANNQPIETAQTLPGLWEHWCEHPNCKRWGSFGEAHGKETHWYCGEHAEGRSAP